MTKCIYGQLRQLGTLCLSAVAAACQPGDERSFHLLDSVEDSTAIVSFLASQATCEQCLTRTEVLRLGDDDGPAYLRTVPFAAIDSVGNYILAQADGPKVFAPDGLFVGKIGRNGQGPGEFVDQVQVFVDAGGFIHLFDRANQRETIMDREYEVVSDRRFPARMQAVVNMRGTDRVVANMHVRTADLSGLPLHVVEGGELVVSFGTPTEGVQPLDMMRVIAVDQAHRIYSAPYSEHEITLWSPEGRRIIRVKREGLWVMPSDPGIPLSEGNPPNPLVKALHVDMRGRLWVILWLARPDWEENVEEVRYPDGTLGYQPAGGTDSVYHSVVEVIDFDRGEIVHSAAFPGLMLDFFRDGLAYGAGYTQWGAPQFVVWELTE